MLLLRELIPILMRRHRHRQFCQSKHRPRKDIHDNLLVDTTLDSPAEDKMPAYQPGEECVSGRFLAGGRRYSEEEHDGFVDGGESGEVARVLPCGFEDEAGFFVEAGFEISPPWPRPLFPLARRLPQGGARP